MREKVHEPRGAELYICTRTQLCTSCSRSDFPFLDGLEHSAHARTLAASLIPISRSKIDAGERFSGGLLTDTQHDLSPAPLALIQLKMNYASRENRFH